MTSVAGPAAPGLDLTRLRGLRPPRRDLELIRRRIEEHLDAHEGYVAFSTGKDSLVTLHLALQVDPEVPVVFFDSGLEYPETYPYLDQLADRWRLNLEVIHPQFTALEVLVLDGGWTHQPVSPADVHLDLHEVLIAEPAQRAHQRFGAGELWGVRADESRGRRAGYGHALAQTSCGCCGTPALKRRHHGGRIARQDGTVSYGPVWDWHAEEIWEYVSREQLPAHPAYARLRALGAPEEFLRTSHLVDGGRLEVGRMVWLKRGWPHLFEELVTVLPRLREYT